MEQPLDLRGHGQTTQLERLVDATDELATDGSLFVHVDEDPRPLLRALWRKREDAFDPFGADIEERGDEGYLVELPSGDGEPAGATRSPPSEDDVRDVLQDVEDPDLGVPVVASGLVAGVAVDGDEGHVSVALDAAGYDDSAIDAVRDAVEAALRDGLDTSAVYVRVEDAVGGGDVAPDPDDVEARLADVRHPDASENVVASGIVEDVTVDDETATIAIDTEDWSEVLHDRRDTFLEMLATAAFNADGVTAVTFALEDERVVFDERPDHEPPVQTGSPGMTPPDDEAMSPLAADRQAQTEVPPTLDLAGIDDIVLVASAKGGVGKTTVATQLARALADDGTDVGLLDADFSGPDVPEHLGLDVRIEQDESIEPVDADGVQAMSVGLMENAPTAWNGEMVHNALFSLFEDVEWDVDVLVVDAPPGVSDTVMTLLQFVPVDGALLVTTPHPTSVEETAAGGALIREGGVPILGVVENMARYRCPSCGDDHSLFDGTDVEDAIAHPTIAELPFSDELSTVDGSVPGEIRDVVAAVEEGLVGETVSRVPDDALDVRDDPDHGRPQRVEDAYGGLEPGQELAVVSDRNPAGLAVALVELIDADGAPSEIFDEYDITHLDAGEWLLRLTKPAARTAPGSD